MRMLAIALLVLLPPGIPAGEDSPKVAANLQMANIATAQQLCYLDFNLLTTIENLDDTLSAGANHPRQFINEGGGALVIDPEEGVPFRRVLFVGPGVVGPPYLTASSGANYEGPAGDYDEGTLLDPWFNPYYLYTPLGLVEPKSGTLSTRFYGDTLGVYAIVSHGPDGVQSDDDIAVTLPFNITRAAVGTATLSTGKNIAVYTLEVRGVLLGASQGSGAVLVNGSSDNVVVTQWTDRVIAASLSGFPGEDATISVRTDAGRTTRAVPLTFGFELMSVASWEVYD